MAKILITGASGFVGNWLVREALERGLETYAGVRSSSSRTLLTDTRINFCEIDFEDDDGLKSIIEKHSFDYIIHNAGVTRTGQDSIYFRVNSDYTFKLAKIAQDTLGSQLKKFVFMSSIEAYGSADPTPHGVVDNSITPAPRTTYGLSKLRAEQELAKLEKLPLIVLRPTAVFGPAEKDFLAIWPPIKKFRFAPTFGDSNIKYSFVYVKDLMRVTIDATLSNISGKSYFVSDGRIYKMKHFTDNIAKALGVNAYGFRIPYAVLEGMVAINKVMDRFTGKKSLLNDEQLAKAKARNWDVDISDLVKDFNYQSRYSLEEALKETTEWYLEQGWI